MFATIENDLQVQAIPRVSWEEFFKISLGLHDVFSRSEFPPRGEAVDVGVHGKSGHAKRLGHHD